MHKRTFLQTLRSLTIGSLAMNLQSLYQFSQNLPSTPNMPALFLGHGSPMNAIEENEFVAGFRKIGANLPTPRAILCVSAHWETKGTWVTAMPQPRTIHDFGGFPQALFDVQYPAPGSPELATETQAMLHPISVGLDQHWGLDHGAWSVIKHLYPQANIPVVQLSLDYTQPPAYHYDLAKALHALRYKGVLIVGSGNLVHNLRLVAWNKLNEQFAFDWAEEASTKIKQAILQQNHRALEQYIQLGEAVKRAIPTPEHFLPVLYTLALQEKNEDLQFFNDKPVAGSLTMTSIQIG